MTTRSSSSSTNPRAILPTASPPRRPLRSPREPPRATTRTTRRFVVASGPYMVEGSDRLDFSLPPAEQEPLTGYVTAGPIEDGLSRHSGLAHAGAQSVLGIVVGRAASRIRRSHGVHPRGRRGGVRARRRQRRAGPRVRARTPHSADQVARYRQDPELSERVFVDTADVAYYITMNLAVPPFDDVHVRRAVNLAIDKAPLIEMMSQPPFGPFGTSAPPRSRRTSDRMDSREASCQGSTRTPYDPAAARQEMRLSAYDRRRGRPVRRAGLPGLLALVLDVRRRPRSGAGDPRRPRRPWHRARTRLSRPDFDHSSQRSRTPPEGSPWASAPVGARISRTARAGSRRCSCSLESRSRIRQPLAARCDPRSAPRTGATP